MFGFIVLFGFNLKFIFVQMKLYFLFIGGPEIFVILLIVVMLFGADKIPEIARGLGKGIRQVKDATNEIKREINESVEKQDVAEEVNEIKKQLEGLTDSKKRER